jgi:hypothetical protein
MLGRYRFEVLDEAMDNVMVHQFEFQGKNVFQTEIVVDYRYIGTQGCKSDVNAMIKIVLGYQELEFTVEVIMNVIDKSSLKITWLVLIEYYVLTVVAENAI